MSANCIDQGYFLASDEELGRLEVQAQVWQPDAEAMLDRIGVGSGSACADMGCGGAGILGPMSRRAGDSGSVLGFDSDPDLLEQTFALRGDINIGRRTFHMFRSCSLEDVQIRTSVQAVQDRHPYMRMPLIGARAMRERMLDAGLTTARELDRLISGVEQAVNDPDRVQFTFTLVQVWGSKPLTLQSRESPTWN